MQGFFEANILTTLTYAEDASSGNTTIPLYVVQGVASAIRCAPRMGCAALQCIGLLDSITFVLNVHCHPCFTEM